MKLNNQISPRRDTHSDNSNSSSSNDKKLNSVQSDRGDIKNQLAKSYDSCSPSRDGRTQPPLGPFCPGTMRGAENHGVRLSAFLDPVASGSRDSCNCDFPLGFQLCVPASSTVSRCL